MSLEAGVHPADGALEGKNVRRAIRGLPLALLRWLGDDGLPDQPRGRRIQGRRLLLLLLVAPLRRVAGVAGLLLHLVRVTLLHGISRWLAWAVDSDASVAVGELKIFVQMLYRRT